MAIYYAMGIGLSVSEITRLSSLRKGEIVIWGHWPFTQLLTLMTNCF